MNDVFVWQRDPQTSQLNFTRYSLNNSAHENDYGAAGTS